MAHRRRRQLTNSDHSDTPSTVEQLACKYMEMCKVESSTDSDSEVSPRWSETSTLGCMSSTPETLTLPLSHRPHGRHDTSLLLDPYDGSSEDSEADLNAPGIIRVRRSKRAGGGGGGGGGGCRPLSRSRRLLLPKAGSSDPHPPPDQHLPDVQMTLESESELWLCEVDVTPSDSGGALEESTVRAPSMDVELLEDSGVHVPPPSTARPGSSPRVPDSSSERSPSPCHLQYLQKRKMCFPAAEVSELGQRKRQCVPSLEDEHEEGGSASEPGLNQTNTEERWDFVI